MTPFIHKKFSTALYALLMCLFMYSNVSANTIKQCDSLIQVGIDAMWKKDYVKSLELLTRARTIAEKNHWYRQQFLAINNIGANYYEMLDYGEALNYYLESYNLALKHLDAKHEMVILNNIAILYTQEENYEKAGEYFKKAYDIAKKNKDKIKIGLYAMNLGSMANERNKLAEAKKYILESLPYLKADHNLYVLGQITLAQNDLRSGNATQAREKAQNLLKTAQDLNFNNIGTQLTMIIIEAYIKEGNYELAEAGAKQFLTRHKAPDRRKTAFTFLSQTYAKSQRFELALQYKDSVAKAEKQLNEIKNGRLFENNRVKFEIQDYKNQIVINEAKLSSERRLFYSIIGFIAVLVTIVILFLRNVSARHKQKKLIAERNQKVIALELEKEKTENREKETAALLEEERLKNEIEARNRKLSAKALYLSGRNQLIEEVLSSLSQLPELAKNPSLKEHIKTLNAHLKTGNEWDSFITHFEEVNHGFITQLKMLHPSLTANDIRFISYIYMNLSTKEIATMLNITAEACRKRKERIAAKMNLPENVLLYDYLSSL
ncbi:tetratricopeptide repeat protein [Flavobacterium sp. DG1-102-2]|uniref:tetratricopeptide repeat protein n=1 Tax=Flavobacterium sp. DG1-102-2 TaxID=3081663 RepID=UPI00294A30F3|nr:tetratricopeptide repeat protein [Flavobacterium sp. DG1-102-2]MDV6167535.1 tetratricopeptide repeat protein [Flavobacterium sp. DG1-102-2]